jgi:carboxyl-terminal processing protease
LFVLLLAVYWLLPDQAQAQSEDFKALGQRIVDLVRGHFYDAKRADAWASLHEDYGAQADGVVAFAALTKHALSELNTSHTDFYTPLEPEYYGLLSIFHEVLGVEPVELEGIGVDFTPEHFVRIVFAGGPGDQARLHRGDKVLMADGKDFDPVVSFRGNAGRQVILSVERKAGQPPVNVPVTPRKVDPKQEWLEAQRLGSRVIEREGKKIAYVPMFSCAGEEYFEALQETVSEKFQEAAALILDFRDGWGGCNPQFLNLFNALPPVQTYIDRNGRHRTADRQWRKPLYLLINKGTRSGKEVVAFTVKTHKLGTLIGERTAGAVMGGRCFLLPGRFLLYLAELDDLVDGQRLEGRGVLPDFEVAGDLPFAEGLDPQLEKALQLASK